MPRKKKPSLSLKQALKRIKEAGIKDSNAYIEHKELNSDPLKSLTERVREFMGIINENRKRQNSMLFFVMYDIESNKVRYQIAKYLIRMGCTRVQKSIFLADLPHAKYKEIRTVLTDVQESYDNEDSILVVPIPSDYLASMKVIGKNINVDLITNSINTLFF